METWEAKVEIPAARADAAETALLESGFGGWSILEDAPARRAWIVGIFPGKAEAMVLWEGLRPGLAFEPLGEFLPRRLPDSDWRTSYREHFKAWTFGRLHWVPTWERGTFRCPAGHQVLWLDPGMAFGTGNHETTRLCIERLVEFEAAGGGRAARLSVVDAGCGSGILALSAALLGFGSVRGFDNDTEAVSVSEENARMNALSERVRFSAEGLPGGLGAGADVVLANIQADILCAHALALVGAVAPGGLLAMSGILASESASVRAAFAAAAPSWTAQARVLGEWSDLALRRPS
ncbi:MAG TPA: 50S ribosomal protein L11 methyltransferase [Opitutaceae bacterium]|jgi:ribosomal protein L11 methyltransferase